MDTLEALYTRRSIRKYQPDKVPEDLLRSMLAAAMSAPSANNAQPWQFVVITDAGLLAEIPKVHPYAAMAKEAPLAVVVCGDLSLEVSPGYWVVDCAAAVENLLLAAHALGLGAVWCGVYPKEERIRAFQKFLGLPKHVLPHSLIPVGYPAEKHGRVDRYREDRVHHDRWENADRPTPPL